ncbi:hypothetical protein HGRIS_005883 [Hohenbuehelia grisea]|uniref:Uncharacterized protein n=1 Tax=Hohenbuehelia grisea TaxID=104357 RepID=A0ABR3K0I0_9AGAR
MSLNKTAIVTGASAGIGRASAVALSNAGWNVVFAARRLEALQESVNLCADPDKCLIVPGDCTNEENVSQLFKKTIERFGRLDLLFNNAGIAASVKPVEEYSLIEFSNVLTANLVGPFLCTQEAIKIFKNQTPQGGRIINNGSLAAQVVRPHSAPYAISKHAIAGLSKCTALEGRAFDITCTQLDIGNALTPLSANTPKGAPQPDGRIIGETMFDPQYVAVTVVQLANLPKDVAVPQMTIMASKAPSHLGRG